MADRVVIAPVSRVGGYLSLQLSIENGKVTEAQIEGTSVRGFENILKGKDPGDVTFITQRICSSCSVANAVAAASALEDAWGIRVPANGRTLRNIALAASTVGNHVTWFYHRALADYIDFGALARYSGGSRPLVTLREQYRQLVSKGDVSPYLPQDSADYISDADVVLPLVSHALDAYRIRRLTDEVIALITGRAPMGPGIVPGGVATQVDSDMISGLVGRLREIASWVRDVYVADILALAPRLIRFARMGIGVPNYLSFGAYKLDDKTDELFMPRGIITGGDISIVEQVALDRIEEQIENSWYKQEIGPRHPSDGVTEFDVSRLDAYSFVKSPRYDNRAVETGPLARLLIKQEKTLLDLNKKLNIGPSVLARIIARSVESALLSDAMQQWVEELRRGEPSAAALERRLHRDGVGVVESPQGALGHWLSIEAEGIALFQVISGSTWNASPRDVDGKRGPIEEALVGTAVPDTNNPINALRIVRSFDLCMQCAAH